MLDFNYENQGVNTYLVYAVSANDNIDTLSLGMLTNNSIPGLAKTLFTQMDEEKYIKYNVSAKISMKQFFGGVVNRKRLLGAFEGIVDGLMSAEDYMIDTSSIILDPEYIFVDVTSCMATLICLPITNIETSNPDLGAFFKNIMVNTQFDQTENSDHVAKIFNFLNSSPIFSLSDFRKLLDDLKQENTQPQAQAPVSQPVQAQKPQQVTQSPPATAQQPKVTPTATPAQPTQPKPQTVVQPIAPVKNPVTIPQKVQPTQAASTEPEKKVSMFGLLMHYSKENKALYEQQKAAKKAGNTTPVNTTVPKQNKQSSVNPGFAVPGANQTTNTPSFAIPGQPTPGVQPITAAQSQSQPSVKQANNTPQPVAQPVAPQTVQNKPYTPPTIPQGQSMNFGETTVLGGGRIGETTVLNGAMQQAQTITPHLIRNKNNEKILLNKPVFRIGKEKSYVDYFIGDNTAVSRSHANIITRENTYFVVDTNSTNHTFVNGKMIQSNTETEIHHGDKIRLGNEDFEFKLY